MAPWELCKKQRKEKLELLESLLFPKDQENLSGAKVCQAEEKWREAEPYGASWVVSAVGGFCNQCCGRGGNVLQVETLILNFVMFLTPTSPPSPNQKKKGGGDRCLLVLNGAKYAFLLICTV